MRRWILIVAAAVLLLPLLAYLVGLFLPRDHEAAMTIDLAAAPVRVWQVISDFEETPKWRPEVTGLRLIAGTDGKVRFVETSSQGEIPFEVVSQDPPRRQVVRVVDDEQMFGGTWTWELVDTQNGGTRLTITERGFVKNPLFRAIGAVFFSPTDTIDGYLRALAKALGESAEPRLGS